MRCCEVSVLMKHTRKIVIARSLPVMHVCSICFHHCSSALYHIVTGSHALLPWQIFSCAAVVHACWNNADRVLFIVFIRLCAHWAGASGGAGARQQQQQPALASERRRGSNGLPRPQPALRLLYRVPASTVLRPLKARVVLGLLSLIGRCMQPAGYLRLFKRGIAGCRAGRLYLLRVLPASASVAQDVGQNELAERFQLFWSAHLFFHMAQRTTVQPLDAKNKSLLSCTQQHSCMSGHSECAAPLSSASKQVHSRMHACQALTANVRQSLGSAVEQANSLVHAK